MVNNVTKNNSRDDCCFFFIFLYLCKKKVMTQQNLLIIRGVITRKYDRTRKNKDGNEEAYNAIVIEWEDYNHYKKCIFLDCKGVIPEEMGDRVKADCYVTSFETKTGNFFTKIFASNVSKE
jgi:hypothetical protein